MERDTYLDRLIYKSSVNLFEHLFARYKPGFFKIQIMGNYRDIDEPITKQHNK